MSWPLFVVGCVLLMFAVCFLLVVVCARCLELVVVVRCCLLSAACYCVVSDVCCCVLLRAVDVLCVVGVFRLPLFVDVCWILFGVVVGC